MKILDLNLLLYAIDSDSVHHAPARIFVEDVFNSDETVALPWSVLLGFLRMSTDPRTFTSPLAPEQAMRVVDGWLALPNVTTLDPGPEHWPILRGLLKEAGTAGNLTADAHLAALAVERGAQLCSTDPGFARFTRVRWNDPVRGRPAT